MHRRELEMRLPSLGGDLNVTYTSSTTWLIVDCRRAKKGKEVREFQLYLSCGSKGRNE